VERKESTSKTKNWMIMLINHKFIFKNLPDSHTLYLTLLIKKISDIITNPNNTNKKAHLHITSQPHFLFFKHGFLKVSEITTIAVIFIEVFLKRQNF
jgi:hypothetical protein